MKESLGALFLDLGICGILSESHCPILTKDVDREIIKSSREYKLLKVLDNLHVVSPEFISKNGAKYKFVSAVFDGYHINVSIEINTDDGPIMRETFSVWELRRFMGLDIPSAVANLNI